MLKYFPTLHPNEWWYSALCRYHVRSGNAKQQTTVKELFGGQPKAAMGSIFPNSTVYQIISQLPSPWDCQNIIMNHTLFPYYVRMYQVAQKEKMLDALCNGESVTLTHIWRSTTKKAWSLRYCPVCVREDTEKYGEPFWHREHQLPLMSVCCTHHCQLVSTGEADPRLNEAFYPLSLENASEAQAPSNLRDDALNTVLTEYLTLPLATGPTEGHNNLAQALMNQGYGIITSKGALSLDASKLYKDLTAKYGSVLIQEVFGNEMSAFVLNRIVKWNLTSPERYILLQNFAGLSTETMFSDVPIEDHLRNNLEALAKTGVTYGKKALAEQLGMKPFQLDTLGKKYGIKPFWAQNGSCPEKRSEVLKIYLSQAERNEIHLAAQRYGFRHDAHFVKFCISKALEK